MRHPTTILLFIVCVAAVGGAMAASGTAGWLGVDDPSVGVEDDVNESEQQLHDYSASRQGGDTSFIGATIAGTDEVIASFVLIFGLSDMLVNAGMPVWGAVMISSPVVWAFGLFIIYMFTGRTEVRPR